MSCFLLPSPPLSGPDDKYWINPKFGNQASAAPFNPTLQQYLRKIKKSIDTRQDDWDRFKKFTNAYEYVHTPVPNSKQAVCRLKPLSRSFYKMIEIMAACSITETLPETISTLHLAEGPGGFIEAISYLRSQPDDTYTGITLQDTDGAVPGWKKSMGFIHSHPTVKIYNGADDTGNLLSVRNLYDCQSRYENQMALITGDGGFDFSVDFDRQESTSIGLIVAQMAFALATQKYGGHFILKVFDTFTQSTVDVLFLLSIAYSKVRVIKPQTSRQGNSERYLVCSGFRLQDRRSMVDGLARCIERVNDGQCIQRLLNHPLPYCYTARVEEINAVLGQQQIESITSTLWLIDSNRNDRAESMKKTNIQKCISWCQRHQLPYNRVIQTTNIFMVNRQRSKGRM